MLYLLLISAIAGGAFGCLLYRFQSRPRVRHLYAVQMPASTGSQMTIYLQAFNQVDALNCAVVMRQHRIEISRWTVTLIQKGF